MLSDPPYRRESRCRSVKVENLHVRGNKQASRRVVNHARSGVIIIGLHVPMTGVGLLCYEVEQVSTTYAA